MGIETKKKAEFIATYLREHRRNNKPLSDEELILRALNVIERLNLRIVGLSYNRTREGLTYKTKAKAAFDRVSLEGVRFGENKDPNTIKNVFAYAIQGALLLHADGCNTGNLEEAEDAISEVALTLLAHGWLEVDAPGQTSTITFELDSSNKIRNFELNSTMVGTEV